MKDGTAQALDQSKTRIAKVFSSIGFQSIHYLLHSLLCSSLFRKSPPYSADLKMAFIIKLRSISPMSLLLDLYPRLFVISDSPRIVPLSTESFSLGYTFLVHCSNIIFIWTSPSTPLEQLKLIFGINSVSDLPQQLPKLDNFFNSTIHQIIANCWNLSEKYLPVEIIVNGSPRKSVFLDILVDDSQICGSTLKSFPEMFLYLRS